MTRTHELVCIVLNWRDEIDTLACITRLLAQDGSPTVVVVDNQSSGRLRELLETIPVDSVHVIESKNNLGFSSGMNLGLRWAQDHCDQGSVVVAINSDTEFEAASSLAELSNAVRASPAHTIVAPAIFNEEGVLTSKGGVFNKRTFASTDTHRAGGELDYLTWACVAMTIGTLKHVGLLDERFFMYWEDVEFGLRAKSKGVDLLVVENIRLTHRGSVSHSRAGSKIQLYSSLGIVALARQMSRRYAHAAAIRLLGRCIKSLYRRDAAGCLAIMRGAFIGLRVSPQVPAASALLDYKIVE